MYIYIHTDINLLNVCVYVVFLLLGDFPASEFYVPMFRNTEVNFYQVTRPNVIRNVL